MRLYNCRVSLGANIGTVNPHHEKPMYGIPKAEVVLLRAIHGRDAVIDIVEVGTTDKSDREIYQALADEFTGYPKYVHLIEQLFSVKLTDLTSDLDDLESDLGGDRLTAKVVDVVAGADDEIEIAPVATQRPARTPVAME